MSSDLSFQPCWTPGQVSHGGPLNTEQALYLQGHPETKWQSHSPRDAACASADLSVTIAIWFPGPSTPTSPYESAINDSLVLAFSVRTLNGEHLRLQVRGSDSAQATALRGVAAPRVMQSFWPMETQFQCFLAAWLLFGAPQGRHVLHPR